MSSARAYGGGEGARVSLTWVGSGEKPNAIYCSFVVDGMVVSVILLAIADIAPVVEEIVAIYGSVNPEDPGEIRPPRPRAEAGVNQLT